jgi:subtilisin family serine protease
MRLSVVLSLLIAALALLAQADRPQRLRPLPGVVDRTQEPKYRTDRVLVRFRPGTTQDSMTAAHSAVQGQVLHEFRSVARLQVVGLGQGASVQAALHWYKQDPNVLYAEPDYIVKVLTTPNDPQFSAQWNLNNTGQNGGTPGADIHAPAAWALSTGRSNVVIGVIDTGVDYTHQDLAANIWSSTSSISVTTAGGAVISCPSGFHGFNAVDASCDPMDDNSHGTHVSGIIGAVGNNGIGVAGVNWNVQILPCKFLGPNGTGDIGGAITCFDFIKQLKDSGINIIATNNSW